MPFNSFIFVTQCYLSEDQNSHVKRKAALQMMQMMHRMATRGREVQL